MRIILSGNFVKQQLESNIFKPSDYAMAGKSVCFQI